MSQLLEAGQEVDRIEAGASQPRVPRTLVDRANDAADRALDALFGKQFDDGHWCAELEGDSILSSEYLLAEFALGHDRPEALGDEHEARRERYEGLADQLRLSQRDDGSWGQYPGSEPDVSATVKAYLSLKLMGDGRDEPHMKRARDVTLELGGAELINTFSTFYLACLGQVSWDACPAIPPEIALLPRWFPFHLDKVASWTRTLIVPLAICSALRPVRRLPSHLGAGELFRDQAARHRLKAARRAPETGTWAWTFVQIDALLKVYQKLGVMPTRDAGLRACAEWIETRSDPATSDGLGAIFPPLIYIQVAYQAMGHGREHWLRRQCERELARWVVEDTDHTRIQPCFSPVWDTGIALYAVTEADGRARLDERVARCCDWLREREVRLVADWAHNLRKQDRDVAMGPGGTSAAWAFEYLNEWSPDCDDTAMVAKALRRAGDRDGESFNRDASERAVDWLLRMQNDDGGWAAFDRTKHRGWMEAVPFADHNAMQDPSCADITGRTVEALITCGVARSHPAIRRAVDYIRLEQKDFGGWFGRWGVNYLYGTWQAMGGLSAADEDAEAPFIRKAVDWLKSAQDESGGFGENANSYLEGTSGERWIGRGAPTASQTAWAVMALMFAVGADDESVERGIAWLCDTQLDRDHDASYPEHPIAEPAGSWVEREFTGTGFPRVFYMRYHLYRHYFPLMALARYRRLRRSSPQ